MKNVISLIGEIDKLENKRMDLIMSGAEVRPELQKQFDILTKKLDKLYSWYSKAYLNGVISGQEPELRPRVFVTR